jgi:agmatinase
MSKMIFAPFLLLPAFALAREIVFPASSRYATNEQIVFGEYSDPDVSQSKFGGLSTYANLPYVHCLAAEGEDVEKFDIAILGAPFDTVSLKSCYDIKGFSICR